MSNKFRYEKQCFKTIKSYCFKYEVWVNKLTELADSTIEGFHLASAVFESEIIVTKVVEELWNKWSRKQVALKTSEVDLLTWLNLDGITL